MAHDRCHGNDAPATAEHPPSSFAGAEERRGEIHIDDCIPIVERRVQAGCPQRLPGTRHQNVAALEIAEESDDCSLIGDVDLDRFTVDLGGGLRGESVVVVSDHHMGSGLGERVGRSAPDAARAAGDHGGATVETEQVRHHRHRWTEISHVGRILHVLARETASCRPNVAGNERPFNCGKVAR